MREIEAARLKGLKGEQFKNAVNAAWNKHFAIHGPHLTRDQASFFILRLAYADTEDHRRWFLNQECALFSYVH